MKSGNKLPIFAERLKMLRESKGKSQDEMRTILGCGLKSYREWETGKRLPNGDSLCRLATVFGVSLDYLFGNIDEKTHYVKMIHEETGLSVSAAETLLSCKDDGRNYVINGLNLVLESVNFQNLLECLPKYDSLHKTISAEQSLAHAKNPQLRKIHFDKMDLADVTELHASQNLAFLLQEIRSKYK